MVINCVLLREFTGIFLHLAWETVLVKLGVNKDRITLKEIPIEIEIKVIFFLNSIGCKY